MKRINNIHARILKEEMEKEHKRLMELKIKKNKHSSKINISVEEAEKFPAIYEVNKITGEVYLIGYKNLTQKIPIEK